MEAGTGQRVSAVLSAMIRTPTSGPPWPASASGSCSGKYLLRVTKIFALSPAQAAGRGGRGRAERVPVRGGRTRRSGSQQPAAEQVVIMDDSDDDDANDNDDDTNDDDDVQVQLHGAV